MKNKSFLLIVGILLVILVGAYTGYLYWQNQELDTELSEKQTELAVTQKDVAEYGDKQVLEAVAAKRLVNDLQIDVMKWSDIVEAVDSTIPKKGNKSIVEVLSYSGSAGDQFSVNMRTQGGSDEPYFDVADLIESFDDSKTFVDGFVPSVSVGTDGKGDTVLTFLLTTKYIPQTEDKPVTISR